MIQFKVKAPSDLPKKIYQFGFNISNRFIVKCITLDGDIIFDLARYDFDRNKWCFVSGGIAEIIEYYDEL